MANIVGTNKSTDTRDGKKSWSLRESYDDETTKTIEVRQAENGFIVRMSRSYYEGEGKEKSYKYEEKEYISKTNPLDEKDKEDKEEKKDEGTKGITDSIKSFISTMTNKLPI